MSDDVLPDVAVPDAPVSDDALADANAVQTVVQTVDSDENGKNGAKPDRENTEKHRIQGKNGGTLTPFQPGNSESARRGAIARWSRYARSGARGLFAAVAAVNPDVANQYDAYGYMVEVQAGIAVSSPGTASECIASTKAAEFVRKAIGADVGAPERRGASDAPASGATLTLSLSGDVAAALAEMLLKRSRE